MAVQGLDTNIDEPLRVLLPSGQEIEASSLTAPDLAGVQRRIKDVVRVLDSFSQLRDPSRPRKDYVNQVGALPGCRKEGQAAGCLAVHVQGSAAWCRDLHANAGFSTSGATCAGQRTCSQAYVVGSVSKLPQGHPTSQGLHGPCGGLSGCSFPWVL